MEDEKLKLGTVNIGVVYKEDSEEGVVLITDRKVSRGSYGQKLPGSYKLGAVSPNVAMTVSGSAGDAQWLIDTIRSFETESRELYEKATKEFKDVPFISKPEMEKLHAKNFAEDLISGKAVKIKEIQKKFKMAGAEFQADPQNSEKRNEVDTLAGAMSAIETEYDETMNYEMLELLKEKQRNATEFFELEEFTLDVGTDKQGNRAVRSALPVRKESWGGSKTFPSVGTVFQRRKHKQGEEVFSTVDGTAHLISNILQAKMKTMLYGGLVGGINPLDGAKLYSIGSDGSYIETKTWVAEGSGSGHIPGLMEDQCKTLLGPKGYLDREDALKLAMKGAIPVTTGIDNYCAPPLDVVLIKRDNQDGEIASYKITADISLDKRTTIVPESLTMEILRQENNATAYYKATIKGDDIVLQKMPKAGRYSAPITMKDDEVVKLKDSAKDVAKTYFKVLEHYAAKQ